MNCDLNSKKTVPILAISLLLVMPVLAWGQHKTTSAPAAKSAPQSHNTAPSHSTGGSHPTTGGNRPATGGTHQTTSGSHPTTGGNRPNTTGGNRPTAGGNRPTAGGNRPNTTGGNRPNTGGNRPNTTTSGNRPTAGGTRPAAGGNRPTAGGNRPAAGGNRPAAYRPAGTTRQLRGGGTANIRPNGSIRSIDRNGMHIEHGVGGRRTVVSERNGARIVTSGRGGYVQRAYVVRGGRTFVSRTYVYGGVAHVGVYRSYYWGGHPYYGWYPGYYWAPGFYAWAWNPWPGPVYWGVGLWGWGGAPWWGFYGGWWNPYPYYAAPAFWLTDYLIASELQAAYAARQEARADEAAAADAQASAPAGGDAQAQASGQVTLTPEVKEAIAEEVKAQIAAQQAQAQQAGSSGGSAPASAPAASTASSGQAPPALDPAQRTFVVDTPVTGVTASGQECGLTAGDVVTRLTDTPDSNQMVNASVSATKKGDCASGQTVAVKVDDLQEMYNHFADQLQSGMKEMSQKQGTNGMPKAPDTSTTASDVPPPKADPSAAQDLQQQQAQADQTETQVKQETAQGGGQ